MQNQAMKQVVTYLSQPRGMLIANRWQAAASGETLEVEDPATGELIARIPAGARADVNLAIRAAPRFVPAWHLTRTAGRLRQYPVGLFARDSGASGRIGQSRGPRQWNAGRLCRFLH